MSRRRTPRRVLAATAAALLVAGAAAAAGTAAAQEEDPPEPPAVGYTLLGRGYAVVFGYPADEVPGGDDEEPEEGAESEPPPPPQTCPEGERGVSEELQARLDRLTDPEGREPVEPTENEVPTPRGQPIKFDFGLADTSLRSDPGSHAIASFFYVDLGGGQDPWTSSEADGYASGHAREEERCGQPYFGQPGSASNVHVISRAIPGPYAFAFNQTQRPVLPGGLTFRESVTVAEMDGRSSPIRATVTTIVTGVAMGALHADEVVTVLTYETDGTEEGTVHTAETMVTGLEVGGTPVEVAPGAPPVAAGNFLVGTAAPEVRRLPDGGTEITAGGLYVAGEAPNPVGLQAKQAVFIGGAWLDTSTSTFPTFDSDFGFDSAEEGEFEDTFAAEEPFAGGGGAAFPSGGFETVTAPSAGVGAPEPEPVVDEPPAVAAPAVQAASSRLGVYQAPMHATGPILVLVAFLGAAWLCSFMWARHRYPEIRAALGTPPLRWLDTAYRSFIRG